MLSDRHADAVRKNEWGPHALSDDWQHCDACLDVPQHHVVANLVRAYWRAHDELRR